MMSARLDRRVFPRVVAILAFVIAMATPGAATPGDLDPTFDGDGKVTTDFSSRDEAHAMAIQGDGKIVAVGFTGPLDGTDFALARYKTDGSLDPTFDGDGKVTTDIDSRSDTALAVALQADGKIVAAGGAFTVSGTVDFALARYNPDGSLDPTFGVGGTVTTDVAVGLDDVALAVAIQADGKIVAAGDAVTLLTPADFAVARYLPNGSLDPTFGAGGTVTTDFGDGNDDAAFAVALQQDGKIVAAGYSQSGNYDFALARYNADGSLDATFNDDGKVTTDFAGAFDQAEAVAIQSDGRIVAAGQAFAPGSDFALARYNSNGSLDPTFDGDGKVTTDFASDADQATEVAIDGVGKIVASGRARVSGAFDFALARYKADGSLDPLWGGDGKVTTDFGSNDQANAVAIQANGRIVAAGFSSEDFALARYKICRTTSRRSSIPC
jgi:uncharacterized delta-60 repeat protein